MILLARAPHVVVLAAAATLSACGGDVETTNPAAQQLYEEGLTLERRRLGEEDFRESISLFERAIAADSTHALAHAGLARAHAAMVHFMYDPTDARRRLSRAAAATALRLRPGLPEGHYAMGVYHYWGNKQYDSAATELDLAAAELASDADILAMAGFVQRRRGAWQEALQYMERAAELDPMALQADLGNTYEALGRFDDAVAALSTAARVRPEGHFEIARALTFLRRDGSTDSLRAVLPRIPLDFDPNAEATLARLELAWVDRRPEDVLGTLVRAPEPVADQNIFWPRSLIAARAHRMAGAEPQALAAFDSARVALEAAVTATPDDARAHVALASALAGLGRSDEAVREAELALQIMPTTRDAMIAQAIERQAATVFVDLGRPDRAIALLTSFFSRPTIGYTRFYLTVDPAWDGLRDHPAFRGLVAG